MSFLLIALALVAVTLLFILPPLLRREPDQTLSSDQVNLSILRDQLAELQRDLDAGTIDRHAYESARHDIQARAAVEAGTPSSPSAGLEKRSAAPWIVSLGIPLLAIALYVLLGNPLALIPTEAGGNIPHNATQQDIADMVDNLAKRLQAQPDDPAGWDMLARSYNVLGEYKKAGDAYARLLALNPNDADVLADYADTLGMAKGRSLKGEPTALIEKALRSNPDHLKALALSGTAAFERGDYKNALAPWQKILAIAPPESDIYRSTVTSIQEAEIRLAGNPAGKAATRRAATVSGAVDIDPQLRPQLDDNAVVFLFAREAGTSLPPVAVTRKRVKDLPFEFVLDDSMSMTPDRRLSEMRQVVIGARISRTGTLENTGNNPQGMSKTVAPGATGVKVYIEAPGKTN